MHDDIKRFALTGIIGSNNVVTERERLIKNLEDQMRDSGYVPVLDMDPQFTRDYVAEKEHYNFELTCYGVFVGKEKSWDTAGMMSGKSIAKHITNSK